MIEILNSAIRFGGAQVPVTPFLQTNIKTIKLAIDWAAENKVDYLVTPEAALSGYYKEWCSDFESLKNALSEIEKYAVLKNVGLCLGTLWLEPEQKDGNIENIKRNQLRFYAKDGKFLGAINKCVTTAYDKLIGITDSTEIQGVTITFNSVKIPVATLICADLYGVYSSKGGLLEQLFSAGAKLFIHPTNAERGIDPLRDEIEEIWIESWIRRASFQLRPFISVDNCYMMNGQEYSEKTMTQSGVCLKGVWVVKPARTGIQYFYHDFLLKDLILERNPY